MEIRLQRHPSANGCTIGDLSINGTFECFTCEDQVREVSGQPVSQWKVYGQTAIPADRYRMIVSFSPRFNQPLPLLLNVPGFSGIRMHIGNTAVDTDGCLLVGRVKKPEGTGVNESTLAFSALMPKLEKALQDGGEIWIDVRNPPAVTT